MPGASWDHCPPNILEWVRKQEILWVSTAPLSADGHVNVSPKSLKGSFVVLDGGRECWYEDMTGSGCETISHLRENGRITVLFSAFEGVPRTCRFFGTGTVYEYGTPEYFKYKPGDTRQPGSRSIIKIDIHKVLLSCGYTVPKFQFIEHRDTLKKFLAIREKPDVEPGKTIQDFWSEFNVQSQDGLPGLLSAQTTEGIPQSSWGNDYMKKAHPKSHGLPQEKKGSTVAKKDAARAPISGKKSGEPSDNQLMKTIGSLDNGLLVAMTQADQKLLLGIIMGVLISTVMSRVGVPIV